MPPRFIHPAIFFSKDKEMSKRNKNKKNRRLDHDDENIRKQNKQYKIQKRRLKEEGE